MNLRRLAIGSVLLLVAGCVATAGTPGTGPATTASPASQTSTPATPPASDLAAIVPWSSETPAPPAAPMTTPTPEAAACGADQLVAGNAGWGGATGSIAGGFLVWNIGPAACRLQGVSSVAIVDATGHALKVTETIAPSPPVQPIVLAAGQSAPTLNEEPASGLAWETFQWSNWCAAAPKGPLSLAVTMPDARVRRLPIVFAGGDPSAPRCDDVAALSTVSVSAFEKTPGPSPSEPPTVPAEALRLALDVPDQATAGQALQYVAALTNPSASAIALTACPAYRESLVTPSGQVSLDYFLNCVAAPSIGPGETVRFAMVFEIPPSQAPTDQAALIWELDPYYGEGFLLRGPAQKVVLRIVAP